MTSTEAKQKANMGEKITHTYFSRDEFVTVIDGNLTDEDGCKLSWDEFWGIRTMGYWQTGWSIYEPKTTI